MFDLDFSKITLGVLIQSSSLEIVFLILSHTLFKPLVNQIEKFCSTKYSKLGFTFNEQIKKYQSITKKLNKTVSFEDDGKRKCFVSSLDEKTIKSNVSYSLEYFEGNYEYGLRNGYGKLFSKGVFYEGYFVENKLDSLGCRVDFNTKEIYFGEFTDGVEQGKGLLIQLLNTNVNCIDKTTKNNLNIEENILHTIVANSYEGEFLLGRKNGTGIETFNLRKYEWKFCNGKFNGKGKLTNLLENSYLEGEFSDGVLNGKGREVSSQHKFEGEYINGEKAGKGKLKTKDFIYNGGFFNGMMHGEGVYESNEIKYKGEFRENKKEGKGESYNKNLKFSYIGNLENDLFENEGKLVFKSKEGENNESCITDKSSNTIDYFQGIFHKGEKIEGMIYYTNGESKKYRKKREAED